MLNEAKVKEVFSDKAYVESIARMSAEDAAKSLCEKGVEVTADDLMKVRDFVMAHKNELQSGELSEEALAEVAGGVSLWGHLADGAWEVTKSILSTICLVMLTW